MSTRAHLVAACRVALWALALACCATLLGWCFFAATDSAQNAQLAPLAAAFSPLAGDAALAVCCTWLSLCAAALLTLCLRQLPAHQSTTPRTVGLAQRVSHGGRARAAGAPSSCR